MQTGPGTRARGDEGDPPGGGRTQRPRVHPQRAIAYRIAAHGLDTRRSASLLAAVAAACGMPDVPTGSAAIALHARLHRLDRLRVSLAVRQGELVTLWGPRRATYLVPAGDALTFGLGALPDREDALRSTLGADLEPVTAAGLSATAAVVVVAAAVSEALRQAALAKDELSAALHGRVPVALESWCGACRADHVPEAMFRLATVAAGALPQGSHPVRFALRGTSLADVSDGHLEAARLELVRRYLRCFGPATPEQFAAWAGTGPEDAHRRWAALRTELVEMELQGRVWMLREALGMLRDPPPGRGARLLPPGDPFLGQRDRATLLPDFDGRRRLWRPAGGPGLVLLDGEPIALWRSRSSLHRLQVRLEALRDIGPLEREEIAAEAQRLAEFRGETEAVLALG